MANDAARWSVLDNPSSVGQFMSWANTSFGSVNSGVGQGRKNEVSHAEEADNTAVSDHTPRVDNSEEIGSTVASLTLTPVMDPAQHHEACSIIGQPVPLSDPGRTGERASYTNKLPKQSTAVNKLDLPEVGPKDRSMTPTQKRVLQRIEHAAQRSTWSNTATKEQAEQEFVPSEQKPDKSSNQLPMFDSQMNVKNELRQHENTVHQSQTLGSRRNDGNSPCRNVLAYYDEKHREWSSTAEQLVKNHGAVLQSKDPNLAVDCTSARTIAMRLNPKVDEFHSRRMDSTLESANSKTSALASGISCGEVHNVVSSPSIENHKALPPSNIPACSLPEGKLICDSSSTAKASSTTICESPSKDEFLNAASQGEMDLAPVLKALGARSVQPRGLGIDLTDTAVAPADITEKCTRSESVVAMDSASQDSELLRADNLQEPQVTAFATPAAEVSKTASNPDKLESSTVILKNLPDDSDYTLVQSLIWGAAISIMHVDQKNRTASVELTQVDDCQRYITACAKGIRFTHNRVEHVVSAEPSPEINRTDGLLQAYLDCGASRVVQVDGADEDLTMKALYTLAEGNPPSREVESIIDSYRRGSRTIIFRFASVRDAVAFQVSLRRNCDWKTKNPRFIRDPCEVAPIPLEV